MQSTSWDGKEKETGQSLAGASRVPHKQPWQTPEIIEEDYRLTESGPEPFPFDGANYFSYSGS